MIRIIKIIMIRIIKIIVIRITIMAMIVRKESRSWGQSPIVATPREVMMIMMLLMIMMILMIMIILMIITRRGQVG